VFSDQSFGRDCIGLLRRVLEQRGVGGFAYCLMPDHAHALVDTSQEAPLSGPVQAWKSLCYRAWRARGRSEAFWQRSFYDHALCDGEDVIHAARYILWNPVRAGLVASPHDYPLSGSFVYDFDTLTR